MVLLSLGKSLECGSSGGNNISRLSRDYSAVGVSNQASVGPEARVDSLVSDHSSSSGKVSLGLGNGRGVSRDNSAIGVGNQGAHSS